MNLNVSKRKKGVYLYIEKSYRDEITGKPRSKVVKSLGYLHDLEKEFNDPIAHFKEAARQMTLEDVVQKKTTLSVSLDEELIRNHSARKNMGYAAILKIWHEIGLDKFWKHQSRKGMFEYDVGSVMLMLVIARLLSPGSKKRAFEEKGRYFERFNFSLDDVYRALSRFADADTSFQRHINEQIAGVYGRNTNTIFYDVTNFYFEIDRADGFRKYGKSKEGRHNPIVQMGLAMDAEGIPLHYEMFPGNKLDKETFRSVIGEVRRNYGTGRVVVVADMGVITGDNIYYLRGGDRDKRQNGYVFSFSVRGGAKDFKQYVLDESGYTNTIVDSELTFRMKSRMISREINVTMRSGRVQKKFVHEKQVVFWSAKYAEKARAERGELIKRAAGLVEDPSKYSRATHYGAAKYVLDLELDPKTGEASRCTKVAALNHEMIYEEERYDGYYSIVTSELDMSEQEIVDTYRGLWEIEDTFRVAKDVLEARPVYVSRETHIKAHFLICFTALVMTRILQKKIMLAFSAREITECLNKISCSHEEGNVYLFDYRSEISDAIGTALGIDFTKKRLRLGEIKKLLGQSKKTK